MKIDWGLDFVGYEGFLESFYFSVSVVRSKGVIWLNRCFRNKGMKERGEGVREGRKERGIEGRKEGGRIYFNFFVRNSLNG